MNSTILRYSLAVMIVGFTLFIRNLFDPYLDQSFPFLFFFLSVTISGWVFGSGPAILTSVLSSLAIDYFYITPIHSLLINNPKESIGISVYLITCLFIIYLTNKLRKEHERVQESEKWFRLSLSSMGEGVITTDSYGNISFINPVAEQSIGFTSPQVLGKPLQEFFQIYDETTEERLENPITRILRNEPIIGFMRSLLFIRRDGIRLYIEKNAAPLKDDQGQIVGVILSFRDITQRKEMEKSLRMSENLFHTAVNNLPHSFVVYDSELRIQFVNEYMETLTERPSSDFLGKHIEGLWPDELEQQFMPYLKRTREEQTRYSFEMTFHTKNGKTYYLFTSFIPILDENNEVKWIFGLSFDITERKRAEEELRRRADEIEKLMDVAPVVIWVSNDPHCQHIYTNDVASRMHNINEGVNISQTPTPGETTQRFKWYHEGKELAYDELPMQFAVAHNVELKDYELQFDDLSGKCYDLFGNVSPLRDEQGNVRGCIAAFMDVTELKRTELQLKELNESLERKVQERTQSLVQYQDQLRRLLSELSQVEQRERQRLAELLHDHLQQMLVAAVMRINSARYKSDNNDIIKILTDAASILEEAIKENRSLTAELRPPVLHEAGFISALHWLADHMKKQHGLNVSLSLDKDAEPQQEQISIILFQTIRELLFNIIKHAQVNEAEISLSLMDDCQIVISVSDHGVGFDPADLNLNHNENCGFGLFSIRERLKMINGRLEIRSQIGAGTGIDLHIPLSLSTQENLLEYSPKSGVNSIPYSNNIQSLTNSTPIIQRILLVDDHRIVREGVASILEEEPSILVIAQAANGKEAIDHAREFKPDIVIMDINMPVMNGIEATRIIKTEFPWMHVIALSVHDEPAISNAIQEAGATAYLNKGGDPHLLIDTIKALGEPPSLEELIV